ncbi:MAG: PqqD family protein [Clostridia bacterium]|nr:PqqD family protein [Clostridia bacterium]
MKLKSSFILREIAGEITVLPAGDQDQYNLLVTLNETGAFLWKKLEQETSAEQLVADLTAEYAVDEVTAKAHISAFLQKLRNFDLITE